jgi:5-methylcytosine-specific restriction enzyme B
MAKRRISSILWRKVNKATVDTLTGRSRGQYDIRLTQPPGISEFFRSVERKDLTPLGGFSLYPILEPFEGVSPVLRQPIKVRYMGDRSERRDWNIPSQRPETAYPLWRQGRGLPTGTTKPPSPPHYIIIARDTEDKFHARWLNDKGVQGLPGDMKKMMQKSEVGIYDTNIAEGPDIVLEICKLLRQHFNVLIYGPPGTGKTHIMQQVIQSFDKPECYIDTEEEETPITTTTAENVTTRWATFHQSYSYEEFIVGLRPDPASSKLLSLTPVPGLLLELTEFARQSDNSSLLVIDEINRGNVSRIFGEFITLLEPDKRLNDDGSQSPNTVQVRLPYIKPGLPVEVDTGGGKFKVPNPFTMPRRLYTLASMNSVDKSIAPLDSAIRRRFHVVNLAPDLVAMGRVMGLKGQLNLRQPTLPDPLTDVDDVRRLALALLESLNRGISFYLGPEYSLGQWYLGRLSGSVKSVDEAKEILSDIWRFQLLPQLEELFNARIEQLETVLRLNVLEKDADAPVYLERPEEQMRELGGMPYLRRREMGTEEVIKFLQHVADVKTLVPVAAEPATTSEEGDAQAGS